MTLLASEWIWVAALFAALFNLSSKIPSILLSFAIPALAGYVLSKLLHISTISSVDQKVILAVWVILALGLWTWLFALGSVQELTISWPLSGKLTLQNTDALQTLLMQMIILLLIVRRSLTLPASLVTSWQAVRSSQIGLAAFLVFGLTTTWENFFSNLWPFALYLFLILIALTTARLAELTLNYSGRSPAFSSSWLISIALLALTFVIIACFSGWLVGVAMVETASTILNFLYLALLAVILILLSPILLLLVAAIPVLDGLVQEMLSKNFGQQQAEFILSVLQPQPGQAENFLQVMNSGVTLILVVITLLILIGIITGVQIHRHRIPATSEEEINELAQVRKMLAGTRKRSPFTSTLDQARRWLASARIRRIYAQLMKHCADLNNPRPPSFTPLEFQPRLNELFPTLMTETTLLTNTYVSIRYGEYPETLDEMQQIHEAWEKVNKTARELIREHKKRMRTY